MSKDHLTINDIARELGVSKSTVSRALRDAHDISPLTKKRILEFTRACDFHPDQLAQNFKRGSSKTIGVVVPAYNIPFYAIAISAIQDYAAQEGYNVMVCHSGEQFETEIKSVSALLHAKVDGIIISVARDSYQNEHLRKLRRKGIPLVMFNRVVEDIKGAKVVVNDYYGAYHMVQYLIESGCQRIAHISGPTNLLLSTNRVMGYQDALRDHGLSWREDYVFEGDFSRDSGVLLTEKIMDLNPLPDAIFCVCDAVAYGVLKVLKRQGLKIPDDISVAGFTNEPMSAFVEPALTTVGQPIYTIGEKAAELLFGQLRDKEEASKFCVLDTELIIRDSTR